MAKVKIITMGQCYVYKTGGSITKQKQFVGEER